VLTTSDLAKISGLIDKKMDSKFGHFENNVDQKIEENNKLLITQVVAGVKVLLEELRTDIRREFHSEVSIELGKVWEELKYLRSILNTHIEMHNQ